jgi:Ras GTPase-activating-like protein IQGAP2/3
VGSALCIRDRVGSNNKVEIALQNKFPKVIETAEDKAQELFNQTKSLTIRSLKMIPSDKIKSSEDSSFSETLKLGLKFAKETANAQLKTNLQTVKANLEKLEKEGLVEKASGYRKYMKAIALEIANRQRIFDRQRAVIAKLNATITQKRAKVESQDQLIETYSAYLRACRDNQFAFKKTKKSKGKKVGPFTYSYSELVKQRVVVSSDVPKIWQKAVKFTITSDTPGTFVIEVKVSGIQIKTDFMLELDELLEQQSLSEERFTKSIMFKDEEVDVVLDVNMTIHLFNKLLAKK